MKKVEYNIYQCGGKNDTIIIEDYGTSCKVVKGCEIVVKPGVYFEIMTNFRSDFCSIPCSKILKIFGFPKRNEKWDAAGILHDYLYSGSAVHGTFTRKDADLIFRKEAIAHGTSKFKAYVMYIAVRLFGKKSFTTNIIKL